MICARLMVKVGVVVVVAPDAVVVDACAAFFIANDDDGVDGCCCLAVPAARGERACGNAGAPNNARCFSIRETIPFSPWSCFDCAITAKATSSSLVVARFSLGRRVCGCCGYGRRPSSRRLPCLLWWLWGACCSCRRSVRGRGAELE